VAEGARGERRAAHPRRSASGEKRARATRSALGERHRAGSQTGVREVRGDRGAGETGAEPHFFLAMAENGPYSHISVARGEEFFDAKVQ